MKAAPKKTEKGIRKCPQRKPAKSKRGLGIEAKRRMAMKARFLSVL